MWHCIQEQSAWYAETAPGRVYAPLVPEVSPEEEELRARIGERIREAAAKKGLSLREVAQRAEVSRGHLWNVLGGKAAASTGVPRRSQSRGFVMGVSLTAPANLPRAVCQPSSR